MVRVVQIMGNVVDIYDKDRFHASACDDIWHYVCLFGRLAVDERRVRIEEVVEGDGVEPEFIAPQFYVDFVRLLPSGAIVVRLEPLTLAGVEWFCISGGDEARYLRVSGFECRFERIGCDVSILDGFPFYVGEFDVYRYLLSGIYDVLRGYFHRERICCVRAYFC